MKNKWKSLFFLLLGINIAIAITILFSLFYNPINGEPFVFNDHQKKQANIQFRLNTNKEDISRLINYYLQEMARKETITYQIFLRDEIELRGLIEFFNQTMNMKMTFTAEPLPNGDLLLRQTSLSLGAFQLPVPLILNVISEQYRFPPWIHIYPNDRLIHVALTEMDVNSNMKFIVDEFDLKNDRISFLIFIPTN